MPEHHEYAEDLLDRSMKAPWPGAEVLGMAALTHAVLAVLEQLESQDVAGQIAQLNDLLSEALNGQYGFLSLADRALKR
jgi:hypothetical protein